MQKRKAAKGFTLVEVLVAVVIVSILATIAIPSYQNYILRNNRAMVKRTLTDLVTRQEAQFLRARQYASSLQTLVSSESAAATQLWVESSGALRSSLTTASLYRIDLACTAAGTNSCQSFVLTATAVGSQTRDSACPSFTLASNGARTPATGDCWER